jgi:L-serine dehydratase
VTYTSLFDLFSIGIGPSSSHTVGPMVAAERFVAGLSIDAVDRVEVELFGSLALTGRGHGTPNAVLMGLAGYSPGTVPMEVVAGFEQDVERRGVLPLRRERELPFDLGRDLTLTNDSHPAHPNVLRLCAWAPSGAKLAEEYWVSTGGGFVAELGALETAEGSPASAVPLPFASAAALLELCRAEALSIAGIAMANEASLHPEPEIRVRVHDVVGVMSDVIDAGLAANGSLPGGLNVPRRAASLAEGLERPTRGRLPPTGPTDWAGVWATAVGEENASGHRIVTAPTNGAAGVIPAVLRFLERHCSAGCEEPRLEFMLTATAIGSLIKSNAGISGAELGCQGEIGSASAMAAAGLTASLGGSPQQVENAAEIALEHNLGLTCDPLGGLVQVPCIERNAIAAIKAISAASLALRGTGEHVVSLDAAIATLRQTGRDMDRIYKETSLGGLAVNVPEC